MQSDAAKPRRCPVRTGLDYPMICGKPHISKWTARTHLKRIYKKLRVRNLKTLRALLLSDRTTTIRWDLL